MKVQRRDPEAAARRRALAVATVGAAVAGVTAGLMVLAVGTAAADEPGRCVRSVAVHTAPDLLSPVVAECPAGTPVEVGEIREGFLYLNDYPGWVAWEHVSLGGAADEPAPTGTETGAGTGTEVGAGVDGGAAPAGSAPVDWVPAPTTGPGTPAADADPAGSTDGDTPSTTTVPDSTPGDA